jgi:nucleoside-diphosphate-sugar epimerase
LGRASLVPVMKKVLLTGASGFVGRHCLPLLIASGYEVHAVSSKERPENLRDAHWHQTDLLSSEQVSELIARVEPTYLLHFAWHAVPGEYWTSVENFRWVQASLHLLQTFAQRGGERLVMAGTCAEYDWKYGYCSEQVTPLNPSTLYGSCKHALHLMLDAFAQQTGLSTAWGRIFFLYGPYEHPKRLVASVTRSLLQGEPALCSHGNQIRDFLHVKDVAGAFVALLNSDSRGAVNIASGRPVALKDIIYKIAQHLHRPDLIQLDAIPAPPDEPPLLVADVARLRDETGWQPEFDLDSGIEQTINWWKSFTSKNE